MSVAKRSNGRQQEVRAAQLAHRCQSAIERLPIMMAPLMEACRNGTATPEQLTTLEDLKDEVVALNEKVAKIGERILAGDPAPHLRKVD
jgi:hypothetical protein